MKNSYSVIKIEWCIKVFRCILKLLPLQGALLIAFIPRALPWAKSFCPFRACCCGLLDHQGVLLIWAFGPSWRCCLYGLLDLQCVAALYGLFGPSWRCCCGLLGLLGVLLWLLITQYTLLYVWNYPVRPSVWLKLSSTPFCTVEIIQYTLLYDWNYPARPFVWLKLSNTPFCTIEITQHALKGQKLLAQGNALGINDIQLTPCKGKSFTYRRGFSFFY